MGDQELVHNVCRNERLTFYNFLRMNTVGREGSLAEEDIKKMINREYQVYFKRDREIDIYREDNAFFKKPALNEVNRRFRVHFASTNNNS